MFHVTWLLFLSKAERFIICPAQIASAALDICKSHIQVRLGLWRCFLPAWTSVVNENCQHGTLTKAYCSCLQWACRLNNVLFEIGSICFPLHILISFLSYFLIWEESVSWHSNVVSRCKWALVFLVYLINVAAESSILNLFFCANADLLCHQHIWDCCIKYSSLNHFREF